MITVPLKDQDGKVIGEVDVDPTTGMGTMKFADREDFERSLGKSALKSISISFAEPQAPSYSEIRLIRWDDTRYKVEWVGGEDLLKVTDQFFGRLSARGNGFEQITNLFDLTEVTLLEDADRWFMRRNKVQEGFILQGRS
jgi:hypothetical protein